MKGWLSGAADSLSNHLHDHFGHDSVGTDSQHARLFGAPLEASRPAGFLPLVLGRLEELGALRAEGIFRVPGEATRIGMAQQLFDIGEVADPLDAAVAELSAYDWASLLTRWLRQLPVPLIPPALYDQAVELGGCDGRSVETSQFAARSVRMACQNFGTARSRWAEEQLCAVPRAAAGLQLDALCGLFAALPVAHRAALGSLVGFARRLEPAATRMEPHALATVFAPSLLRHPDLLTAAKVRPRKCGHTCRRSCGHKSVVTTAATAAPHESLSRGVCCRQNAKLEVAFAELLLAQLELPVAAGWEWLTPDGRWAAYRPAVAASLEATHSRLSDGGGWGVAGAPGSESETECVVGGGVRVDIERLVQTHESGTPPPPFPLESWPDLPCVPQFCSRAPLRSRVGLSVLGCRCLVAGAGVGGETPVRRVESRRLLSHSGGSGGPGSTIQCSSPCPPPVARASGRGGD